MPRASGFGAYSVGARRFVRKMRGASQPHLVEGDDGAQYVVKFCNNPLGSRILVNELVTWFLMDWLGITVPPAAVVRVDEEFVAAHPDIFITVPGHARVAPAAGVHFGSRHPGTDRTPVFDFLPDSLIQRVINRDDFLGAMVFDKWVSNADGRQAIFFRACLKPAPPGHPTVGWVAQMIDNGLAFQGDEWEFRDSAVQGLYPRQVVYRRGDALSIADFEPWLSSLLCMDEDVLYRAFEFVPRAWLRGEEAALVRLLRRLYMRRKRVPELMAASIAWLNQKQMINVARQQTGRV